MHKEAGGLTMGLGMDIILTDLSSPIASKPLDPMSPKAVGSKLHRERMFYELCVRRKKLLVPTGNCGSHGEFDPGSG